MRKLSVLAPAVVALALAPQTLAKTVTVRILNTGFSPAKATIARGDTVVWKNDDTTQHQVVADDNSFKSPMLAPRQTFSRTFNVAAIVGYHGALHPTVKGTINVASATISSSRQIATYGTALTLTGTVSGATAGEQVTIHAIPFDGPQRAMTVTTGADGSWSLRVAPLIQTRYSASTGPVTSNETIVFVRPRVVLRRLRNHRFKVTVLDLNPLSGNSVSIARWSPRQHQYRRIARVHLRASADDAVWTRTFRLRVHRGPRLRAFITALQAGPGYLFGRSNGITA